MKGSETLDLEDFTLDVTKFVETIGSLNFTLTKQVEFVALTDDNLIVLENSDLSTVSVEIPDLTTISGPSKWNYELLAPITIPITGEIPSGFEKPSSVIQVGNPGAILVFDKTVTIIWEGITGQIAYKLPGETTWNLIALCLDTYDNPRDPSFPNECSISDELNTKIVTYHFTEFGVFPKIPEESTEEPDTSSGGGFKHLNTGGSSGITKWSDVRFTEEEEEPTLIPQWLKLPVSWWLSNEINNEEFFNMITWLVDNNILQIEEKIKPKEPLSNFNPSIKNIFLLWHDDKINERVLMGLIEKYRELGIW